MPKGQPGRRITPQPLEIGPACTIGCSLNPRKLPIADIVTGWYSAGFNNEIIRERVIAAGFTVSEGALARHRKAHLVLSSDGDVGKIADASAGPEGERVDHVKVLEAIIARGARSIHTWRVGPDMTIKAMDMWYRLTQGNAQQTWLDDMAAAIASSDQPKKNHEAGEGHSSAFTGSSPDPGVEDPEEIEAADGAA